MAEFNNLLDQKLIMKRRDLTSTEKWVAVVLLSFRNASDGRCDPPIESDDKIAETVCTQSGFSRPCIKKTIESLKTKGIISVASRTARPSQITFLISGDTSTRNEVTGNEVTGNDVTRNEVTPYPKRGYGLPVTTLPQTNKEQINNKEEKESKEKDSFSLTPVEDKPQRRKSLEKPFDVSQQTWDDFNAIRKAKKAPLTETAIVRIRNEAKKAGITIESALQVCCERGWQGFKADWYVKTSQPSRPVRQQTIQADPTPEDFSDNQISLFAYRISREKPYTVLTPGYCESYEQLQKRIESQLRHPENFKKFIPVLRELHLIH